MGRGIAVVLFTDLVGSTELRERLGEEAAEELRRAHDRVLAHAVERHGGRVVKGLGDGLMASFATAADGVAGAVAIQQAIDRHNRADARLGPIAVRVGMSLGDVTVEDGDVHGTPVVEAARLCSLAHGGQILSADAVRILARHVGDFVSIGAIELKGLSEPVPACEVLWKPLPAPSIPLPALVTDVSRSFVGRDNEVQQLQRLWEEAAAGERRLVFLAGEPGVGKTRLAAELAAGVHAGGGLVLAGRCDEDLGVPYQPIVEALRHFIQHTPPERLGERLGRYAGDLVRLVPELTDRVAMLPPPLRSDPDTERYRLFDAVVGWLVAASDTPLLLVVDDLQWAAKPTVLLLRHMLQSAEPGRAVDYLSRAGDRALRQLAPDQAVGYYLQALELVAIPPGKDGARDVELLISLGRAQRSAGDAAHRDTLLAAAKTAHHMGNADALARAALENIRGSIFSTTGIVDEERVDVLEAALRALPAEKEVTRARLLAALGLELHFQPDRTRRVACSDEAVILARRSRDSATLAYVLAARYYTILAPGTVAERRTNTAELLTLAADIADPVVTAWAHWLSWRLAMETTSIDDANYHHQRLEELAGGLGQPTLSWGALAIRSSTLLLAGQVAEAERVATTAAALAEGNQPDAALVFANQLFGLRMEQGRLDEVRPWWLAEAERSRMPLTRAFLAVIESEHGLADEARMHLEELATSGFDDVPLDQFWLLTLSCAATATARIGHRDYAGRLHALLEPFADQLAGVGELWFGSVRYYLGLLAKTVGDHTAADAHFAAAASTHDRIGALPWLARTHVEWAGLLLTRRKSGDSDRARGLLRQALAPARELGFTDIERRAVSLLQDCPSP